jgi:hypothetical protein
VRFEEGVRSVVIDNTYIEETERESGI